MKVLDLQCSAQHRFEGWFASEEDFLSQCDRALVQCPLCGDAQVHKTPSAPRLNLISSRHERRAAAPESSPALATSGPAAAPAQAAMAAWLELSRRLLENTQDVGEQFAQEARKMHYGETEERAIRGQTTLDDARALVEEGIELMPLLVPESLKGTLQ